MDHRPPRRLRLAPLRLAFFTPLTAALDTFDLAGDLGVLVRRVGLRHRVAEIVQFAARKARQFLFGLRLADRPDRILDLPVGIGDQLLRLQLGLFEYLLPLGPDLRQLPGIGLL